MRNISSYVVKSSKGKKNVLLLSTLDPILGVTKDDEKQKTALYKLYEGKGGTDIVDQKMGTYTVKSKSRKWTMVAFSYLLNTTRVNACTILALNQKKRTKERNAFDFGYALAEHLAMPQIRRRSKNGLISNVISKIQIATSNKGKDNSGSNDPPNEPDRCKICLDGIKGQHYKTKKNKISRIVSFCMKCKEHCCKKHSVRVCKNCSQ